MGEKTTIRIRRGLGNTRYCACDAKGSPLMGFHKLSDVRRHWKKEIQWGHVVLVRELDQMPDLGSLNGAIAGLDKILESYAKRGEKLCKR